MPQDLRLDIVVVSIGCALTILAAVRIILRRTMIRFAAVLIAGSLTLAFVEPTIPVLVKY